MGNFKTKMSVYMWSVYLSCYLAILYLPGVLAPRCFVCNSATEPACGYSFMLKRSDRKYIERCATSCFMFIAGKDENKVVSRGCLPGIKTIPKCQFDEKDNLNGVMCTCNTGYCNVASGLRTKISVMLLCLFMTPLASLCVHRS